MKCNIVITQNTKGWTDGDIQYTVNVDSIQLYPNSYSQVGIFPKCTYCYSLGCNPTGLIFVPFIERGNENEVNYFINEVNEFLCDNNRTELAKNFRIASIDAEQTIIFMKEEKKNEEIY